MIYLKGHIYLLGCQLNDKNNFKLIEKYSISSDSLEIIGNMSNDREFYCVWGFIDIKPFKTTNSNFDTN